MLVSYFFSCWLLCNIIAHGSGTSIAKLVLTACTKDVSIPFTTRIYADFMLAISLTGLNLEIANAASSAGFDTWKHKALYDLIWAVKRVALRHSHGPVNLPPPRNPYYPDRYRPSGLGDNTNKKRPAPPEFSAVSSVTLEPKARSFHGRFRAFKYTNTRKKLNPQAASYVATTGFNREETRDNPIDLLLEDEEDSSGTQAKKQKLNSGNASATDAQSEAEHSQTRTTGGNTELPEAVVASTEAGRVTSGGAFTQQADFVSLMDMDLDERERMAGVAPLSPRPSPPIPIKRGFAASGSVTPAKRQLDIVRRKLETASEGMISSRTIMKRLFDKSGEMLNLDETMPALTFLSKCLEVAEVEAKKGVKHVDRVVELVSRK